MIYDPREHGADCNNCPLNDRRPVPPELRPGRPLIVGMEPGANEVKVGRPFIGPSGKLLATLLAENGQKREDFSITNARLCAAPPIWAENDARQSRSYAACRPRLMREVEASPSVLMLGKSALVSVFGKGAGTGEGGIMAASGYPLDIEVPHGIVPISGLASFHPAFVLRSPRWRETARRDLAKFWRLTHGELNWVEPEIVFDPTLAQLDSVLARFDAAALQVAIDTETDGLDPETANLRCVGLANANLGICLGFRSVEEPRRTFRCPPERARERIAAFLPRFAHGIAGHNVNVYDRPVLDRHGMPLPDAHEVADTLAMHHVVDSEMPHKLGFVGRYYLDVPKWKAEDHDAWASDEELHTYCALDCCVTARVLPELENEIERSGQWDVYRSDVAFQKFAVEAHRVGICVDEKERQRHGARFDAAVIRCQEIADEIIGRRINLASPKQVSSFLYDECGVETPADWEPGEGSPSTGVDALYEILSKPVPEKIQRFADNLILYRRARMWRVRYVDACAPGPDGRVHPTCNVTSVLTGRPAFSGPPMGQIPDRKHDVDSLRSMFVAEPGNVLVYADMAQIQLRQMALAACDEPWLSAFLKGLDVHRVNGETFFGIPYDKIGKGSFERDFAKTLVYMYIFGGFPETAMRNMHKVRNPRTGERPYARFTLAESELKRANLLRDHPALPRFWKSLVEEFRRNHFLVDRILGRRRYFRDMEPGREELPELAAYVIQAWEASMMGGSGATGKLMASVPHGLYGPGLTFHGYDSMLLEVRAAEEERARREIVAAMSTEIDGLPFPAEAKSGLRWSELG